MSSIIDDMNFPSTHRILEIPEFLVVEKDLVDGTKKQKRLSNYDHSNIPNTHSNIPNTLDYELIQAFRENGL